MVNRRLNTDPVIPSHARLRQALPLIGSALAEGPLRRSSLARLMRETFGGSDAAGAWSWRMAYDAMQAAAVMQVVQGTGQDALSSAGLLASRLLTETRRSEQQIRLQQFSTPLPYAALVARAAAIRSGETFLEPSAGTGALAGFVLRAGGKPMLNEIDPFRRALLEAVFAVGVTGHDAEHIDDLLATPDLPGVIVMNPPFASSVDRSRDRYVAAKHLIGAAKRLAPGGRLVAIMPTGFSLERDAAHWARASSIAKPRLALTIPGHVYRKLGTTVETRLMVFDKVQEEVAFVRAVAADLEAAQHIVDDIAATRSDAPLQSRAQVRAIPRQGTTPTVRSRRVVASSTCKPKALAAVPLSFTALDTPRENTPVSDIYARYRPQRIEIAGAQEHPTPLVESIAMASVAPPAPSSDAAADLRLPGRLIEEGHLSEAQLETILMANDAHERDLPGRFTIDEDQTRMTRADDDLDARAYRLGYFLGDGTGCGKGRECAGLILVNWLAGRRKAVWISKSATLIEDAIRDWTDLGGSPADILPLSKWKPDQTNASAAKSAAKSRFESTKQRFFNHLLLGMKAPTIIRAIGEDLAEGYACVIQVVSTGESLLKRRLEAMDPEDELTQGALTPRDYVVGYLEQAFPIHAQKLVEIDGNVVAEPLRDADGALVVSREAEALRDAAMMELMALAPIPSALDQILWAFGDEAVAEVTGRSVRPLKSRDGALFIEKRSASSNSSETRAFMEGEKDILIFSDAGGTGRSYHAARSAKNQKRRRHYLLEPGWRADAAIQGLGRTHRSAQVSAPFFRVCTSDVHGEKRFTSTIARRLDQLGALTKGQRETGSQGMFREEDNLESPIARGALRGYYADLAAGRAGAMSYERFADWTALRLLDQDGVLLEELPPSVTSRSMTSCRTPSSPVGISTRISWLLWRRASGAKGYCRRSRCSLSTMRGSTC